MTHHSQFIVITHSKRTMEIADVLYGVTMERRGISTLVSVELRQGERALMGRIGVSTNTCDFAMATLPTRFCALFGEVIPCRTRHVVQHCQ